MDLQQLVEQLASQLGRAVSITDLADELLVSSESVPVHARNQLVTPIRDSSGPIAVFRLAVDDWPPLTAADYVLIDSAASIARDLLPGTTQQVVGTERALTMGRLLDDDGAVRRAAHAEAVARRWLDTGGRTVVRAVVAHDSVTELQRTAFGRHLAALAPVPTTFIREHESRLYLVSREVGGETDLNAWMHGESERLSVPIVSIGSAHHDRASADLGEAADQARVAAELTAALPELQPSSSIDELGGWVLLHAVAAGSRRLGDISPAAEMLARTGDSLQRQTIETYLDEGGRTSSACAKLHIHRTTLYYRLDNMPAVVRDALGDGMKRSTLHLSLKLMRLWEATGVS